MAYPPPRWLRHKTRGFPNGPLLEEMWDSGGRRMVNGQYVGGDYFRSSKDGTIYSPAHGSFSANGSSPYYYDRDVYASAPDRYQFDYTWSGNTVYPWVDFADIDQYAATAWNRMRPDRPNMSLLNAVYELKDVPHILKPRILKYRDTKAWADYYLAIQFGWLPLLKDCQDFVRSTLNLKATLDQLQRDNGKLVHRTFSFKGNGGPNSSHAGTVIGQSYAAFPDGMVTQVHADVPVYTDTLDAGVKTWATGNFRYFLPEFKDDWRWRANMYSRILGLRPSPSTVWHAIPWTWLVDWFSNIGDVLENIDFTVADRLVAESAFLMQRRYEKFTRNSTGHYYDLSGKVVQVNASTVLIKESKVRTIINPFGPAINDFNMSGIQSAILGAIGLTRMPTSGAGYNGFNPVTRNPIIR